MAIYDAVRTHFIPLCTLAGLGRTLFQMDQQQGYRRRGNTGDTAGLTQGVWSGLAEFGFDFIGEAGDAVVIEIFRQGGIFTAPQSFHLILLAGDVAFVFGGDFNLFGHCGLDC